MNGILTCIQSGAFYSKSLAFTKNDLIPQSGLDKLFTHFDSKDKGTLVCLTCQLEMRRRV